MTVNFAEGIKIVVDDEMLISWQQLGKTIVLAVNEKGESVKYEVSPESKEVKRCSN